MPNASSHIPLFCTMARENYIAKETYGQGYPIPIHNQKTKNRIKLKNINSYSRPYPNPNEATYN